jgi:uncharacterized short protein YbdD (DUF466 family)
VAERRALPQAAASVGLAGRYLAQTLRLMVGVPDYGAYCAHMAQRHPGRPVMTYEQFFVERQQARYGSGRGARCC